MKFKVHSKDELDKMCSLNHTFKDAGPLFKNSSLFSKLNLNQDHLMIHVLLLMARSLLKPQIRLIEGQTVSHRLNVKISLQNATYLLVTDIKLKVRYGALDSGTMGPAHNNRNRDIQSNNIPLSDSWLDHHGQKALL